MNDVKKSNQNSSSLPVWFLVALIFFCLLPSILNLFGVDFKTDARPFSVVSEEGSVFNSILFMDMMHYALAGSFIHTLLEWTAVCIALFTAILAFTQYSIRRDVTTPIIGAAFLCAGAMDAFYTLAADRLIEAVADNRNLIPFAWALSRMFNALILITGVGYLLSQVKPGGGKKSERGSKFVIFTCIIYVLAAYFIIHLCATSYELPETFYHVGIINRPFDILPLLLFVFAGVFLFPKFYKKHPSVFSHALIISVIPQIFAQLHVVFGSSDLYDNHFNIAIYMKVLAYLVPFAGLVIDYGRTYERLKVANLQLSDEIVERKKAEKELFDQKEILQSVLDNIGEGVVVADNEGKFILWNPAATEIVGIGPKDVSPEDWSNKYGLFKADKETPLEPDEVPLYRTLKGESIDAIEIYIKNKDLKQGKYLSVTGRPIKDLEDKVTGGVVVFRDETERKNAEEERSRVFNLSSDLLCIADFQGYFKQLNPSWEKALGFTSEELASKPFIEFVHPEDKDATLKEMENLSKGNVTISFENRYLTKNGGYKWLFWSATPYLETGLIYAAARDITDRKKMEQDIKNKTDELARSNKELEQFAYVASHDLQEPLRMVASYTQLLAKRYQDKLSEEANEFIDFAVDGAKRMQNLINDLLEYSRVGTRGKPLVKVSTSEIVGKVLNSLKIIIDENEAFVDIGDLPDIYGDQTQLSQLFQNLIGNAIKYRGKASPEIKVEAADKGDRWVFAVKDNGIGFDKQYAERIFVIFQRLHTKEEYKGTGIGLAICKKIVERHGGTIWVESTAGKGSAFFFTIPKK